MLLQRINIKCVIDAALELAQYVKITVCEILHKGNKSSRQLFGFDSVTVIIDMDELRRLDNQNIITQSVESFLLHFVSLIPVISRIHSSSLTSHLQPLSTFTIHYSFTFSLFT